MKELLFKRKSRFYLYIFACFFPVITDLMRMGLMALFFEAIQKQDKAFFINIIILTGISIVLSFLIYITSRMLRISFMRDTILDIRNKAFDKIINTSYKNFNKKSKDVYISNLLNDINTFESNFFVSFINFVYQGGLYIVSIITLIFLEPILALVMFLISVLMLFLSKKFENRTIKLQQNVSSENENFTINMSNTLNGLEILKLNNIEKKFLDKSYESIDRLERRKFRFRFFSDTQRNITNTLGFFIFLGTLIYLLMRINSGSDLSYGILTLILQLASNIAFNLTNVLPRLNVMKSSKAIYEKITKPVDEEDNLNNKTNQFSFNQTIQVNDLYFDYDGKEIFKGASFTIEKGKKYLIKGPSGVGKSTLMKLISMTYDNYQGEILVDGVNYKTIKEKSFNDNVSFVYQDVFLFEDTIKNNVTLFKNLEDEKVTEAIIKAGLKEFVDNKPKGIKDIINENGKNLSGGERQRISIARAIVKDARILFVDEGTSALNEELGQEIENAFLSLDSTVISISHRYYKGITDKYDYIIEIKNGKTTTYTSENYFGEVVYAA